MKYRRVWYGRIVILIQIKIRLKMRVTTCELLLQHKIYMCISVQYLQEKVVQLIVYTKAPKVKVGLKPSEEPARVNVGSSVPKPLRVEPDCTGLGRRLRSEHASSFVV